MRATAAGARATLAPCATAFTTSYVVCQLAAHFGVRWKLMLDPSDMTGGVRKTDPPRVGDVIGDSVEGCVSAACTHSLYAIGFTRRNASQRTAGSNSMMFALPDGGRVREAVKVKDASHPSRAGTRNCGSLARGPGTGCTAGRRASS